MSIERGGGVGGVRGRRMAFLSSPSPACGGGRGGGRRLLRACGFPLPASPASGGGALPPCAWACHTTCANRAYIAGANELDHDRFGRHGGRRPHHGVLAAAG